MYKPALKYLIISTFPPKHCGIATYAQEQFRKLKDDNHIVYTMSPADGSQANFKQPMHTIRGMIKIILVTMIYQFHFVELHFTNGLFWARGDIPKFKKIILAMLQYAWIVFLSLRYGKKFNFLGHEIETKYDSRAKKFVEGITYFFVRRISVHTESEKQAFKDAFGPLVARNKIDIIDHKENMTPKFGGNKFEARAHLNLEQNQKIALCIGFLQKHKGFDIAVQAISKVPDFHLHVVGSMRVKADDIQEYRDELSDLISKTPNATLFEDFVNDVDFDAWIQAADVVILPYHEIWSSGVGARSQILGTPLLVKGLPSLKNQFAEAQHTLIFNDESQLVDMLKKTEAKTTQKHSAKLEDCTSTITQLAREVLTKKKFLFVMPTFGKGVKGGAEGFIFDLANELGRRGCDLEVWATDSSQVIRRNHAMKKAPSDKELPFKVRRFRANVWSERIFDFVHRYMNQEEKCGPISRMIWKYTNLHGFGMSEALREEAHRFDVIHLFHYLLGSSHRLSGIAPDKMILHPFIHDEPPLRSPIMRDLFAGVKGVTINTEQSYKLTLGARCGLIPSSFQVIGNGVEPSLYHPSPNHSVVEEFNECGYIVFVGRMIPEKNLNLLFEWHQSFLSKNPDGPALICLGSGPLEDHNVFKSNPKIKSLGWTSDADKKAIIQNASALINLSLLESFSIVIMEAWLEEIPVIVHKNCWATAMHIEKSGSAGFAVEFEQDYIDALNDLKSSDLRKKLGILGRRYVEQNYTWDNVCNNYALAVARILNLQGQPRKTIHELSQMKSTKSPDWDDIQLNEILSQSFYVEYEENARDGENIPDPWNFYAEKFVKNAPSDATLVDIGAGRGDLLHFFKNINPQVSLFGVEPDRESFYQLRRSGLNGALLDGSEFGDRVELSSIDFIFMTHVVEHIPWNELVPTLFKLRQTLKPGGKMILEFPNMLSSFTGATYFWSDPTHIKPVPVVSLHMALKRMEFKNVDSHQFSPHLSKEEDTQLRASLEFDKMVDDFYGNQDFVFVCEL